MYENKIAYLVPAYNHENYVLDLLNSISDDIKKIKIDIDKELIVIDDGSTDNTNTIIENWCKNNKVDINYKTRKNKGLTITLNELISSTNATYLRLCASDDIIVPGSSELLLQSIESKPNLLAVCGDAIIINDNNDRMFDSSIKYHGANLKKLIDEKTSYEELILHWCIAGPASLIKKEFYESMKYLENEAIDDFYLYLTLIEKNALKIISDKLCYYRIHNSNTSKTIDRKKRISNLMSFLKIIYLFPELEKKYKSLVLLKSLTISKIAYLERRFFKCTYHLCIYFYYKVFQ